ncbi:MAG: filamentous hemagglutinin family protein [Gammaproteobacteria bacterium]
MGCLVVSTIIPRVAVAELPVPCQGGCSNPALSWRQAGSASLSTSGNTMQIDQHSDRVQLNWQTFNIGRENTVRFNQPSSSSTALNRVFDPNANPSRILGNLIANGQVYLINRNGIVFGEGARVDVNSLVASTLDIDPALFESGFADAIEGPEGSQHSFEDSLGLIHIADENGETVRFRVNSQGDYVVDETGSLIIDPEGEPYPIFIKVREGAEIKGGEQGRVWVFAPNIENDGEIIVPDGQAILAAGNRVYLQPSKELRGFLVEVDTDAVSDQDLDNYISSVNDTAADDSGDGDNAIESLVMGNIINRGAIRTERGNINLAGLAINQQGTLSATTAVRANGRIRLLARDTVDVNDPASGDIEMRTSRTGHIRLGKDSTIEILPDTETASEGEVDTDVIASDAPERTDVEYYRSAVELMARVIEMEEYSKITVPSGGVFIDALRNPFNDTQPSRSDPIVEDDSTAVRMAENSEINVVGVQTDLPMERNVIEVELRGNELADAPLQRDGILRGEKARIDLRTIDGDETIPIANLEGALNNIERTIAEKSTAGGGVFIRSLGGVTIDENATIDVSGGAIHYQDGYINTTHLISDGAIVEISEADPNMIYDHIQGQVVRENKKWNKTRRYVRGGRRYGYFEPGYVEGKDAGVLQVNAYNPQIWGNLLGRATPGRYQRNVGTRPRGGELIIGDPAGQNGSNFTNYVAPHVVLTGQGYINNLTSLVDQGIQTRNDNLLFLSSEIFERNGFEHLQVYSNGKFLLNENVFLNPAGSITVRAREIEIAANITAPGGDIDLLARKLGSDFDFELKNSNTPDNVASFLTLNENDLADIAVTDGVMIRTEGLWTNDSPDNPVNGLDIDYREPIIPDGGDISVNLESEDGVLRIGDNVAFDASGGAWLQSSEKYIAGNGGDINIGISADSEFSRSHFVIGDNLQLKSYSLKRGGSLELTFPEIVISPDNTLENETGRSLLAAGLGQSQTSSIDSNDADLLTDLLLETYNDALQTIRDETGNPDIAFDDIDKEQFATLMLEQWQTSGITEDINVTGHVVLNELINPLSENPAPDRGGVLADIGAVNMLDIPVSLVQSGGFSSYSIHANSGNLILTDHMTIRPRSYNYIPSANFKNQPNSRQLSDFATPGLLDDYLRPAVDLNLASVISRSNAPMPVLEVPESVSIETDVLGSVTLATNGQLLVNGHISAPGGTISLATGNTFTRANGGTAILQFDPDRGVVLETNAMLSVVGASQYRPAEENRLIGDIYDAGEISILAEGGYVDVRPDAVMDVSGATETFDVLTPVHVDENSQATGGRYERHDISSNAGSITISSSEGFKILGDMEAAVGNDNARGGSLHVVLDSNIASAFDDVNDTRESYGYASDDSIAWTLTVDLLSEDPSSNENLQPLAAGQGKLYVDQFQSSGFDSLSLFSSNTLRFDNRVDIDMGRAIAIASPAIDVVDSTTNANRDAVRLNAPYLRVTGSGGTPGALPVTAGPEELLLGGDNTFLVELQRNSLLHNIGSLSVQSQGDVRLRGARSGITVNGDINIQADQVYTTTQAEFSMISTADEGVINIDTNGSGVDPVSVISAGGILTLQANTINQGGVLKAPLGEIHLMGAGNDTASAVTLLEGSVTQTAADVELIPFGETTLDGNLWQYLGSAATARSRTIYSTNGYESAPEQHLTMDADSVAVNSGARVDIRGGGELVGYEFVRGPGGSKDVTSAAIAQAEGTYALLPWLQGEYAPYDSSIYTGWDIEPGLSVYLNEGVSVPGNAGQAVNLDAGEYPLLPARYAMLPGSVLVSSQPEIQNLPTGLALQTVDGASVISGRFTTMNTSLQDQLAGGIVIRPASYARDRSEIRETYLSAFLAQKHVVDDFILPRLPGDAGVLSLAATNQISLDGTFATARGAIDADGDGRADVYGTGADVDISASAIHIVPEKTGNTDVVELTAAELHRLEAESLLLGGARTVAQKTTDAGLAAIININSTADNITVIDGVELTAPEILLVTKTADSQSPASPNILLQSGSTVKSGGTVHRPARDIEVDGDGTLVRLSENTHVAMERSNAGTASASVVVEEGALLEASSSVIVESSQDVIIRGEISAGGGSVTLGANLINLGNEAGDGLNLTTDFVDRLAATDSGALSLNQLILVTPNPVLFNNNIGLDENNNPYIDHLVLQAPGILAADNATDGTLAANTVTLHNMNSGAPGAVSTNTNNSQLNIIARSPQQGASDPASGNIIMRGSQFTISGYDVLNVAADAQIIGAGDNSGIHTESSVNLVARRLTTSTGAQLKIDTAANGTRRNITYSLPENSGHAPTLPDVQALGGNVTLLGSSVNIDAPIVVPSGSVSILTDGADGDIWLGNDATIDVAGRTKLMGNAVLVSSWGGSVNIRAENGLAILEAGSVINVSGANPAGNIAGNDAGFLSIYSGGARRIDDSNPADPQLIETRMDGTLLAHAREGYRKGTFMLDTNNAIDTSHPAYPNLDSSDLNDAEDFAALNVALNDGQFAESRNIRYRNGDIIVAGESTPLDIVAHNLTLTADQGAIELANTLIDATSTKGGRIEIFAHNDVTVSGTTHIDASATAFDPDAEGTGSEDGVGGTVFLSSETGAVAIGNPDNAQGAVIDVSGSRQLQDYQGDPLFVNGQPVMADGKVRIRVARESASSLDLGDTVSSIAGAKTIDVEAFQVYGDSELADGANGKIIDRATADAIAMDTENYMANEASALLNSINVMSDSNIDNRIRVMPGVDIRTSQALEVNVDAGWDLFDWKYGSNNVPGVLTIRSQGELDVQSSLTDGFYIEQLPPPRPFLPAIEIQRLDNRESWSYRLTSGADINSANPYSLRDTADAHLAVASETTIRTGTGDIDINVAGDLILTDSSSTIFTSGIHTLDYVRHFNDFTDRTEYRPVEFPDGGGDVRITVKQDIISNATSSQMITPWLWRQGGAITQVGNQRVRTAWGIDIEGFGQGIAAFGGGDIDVKAGGNINNVSFSIPGTGLQTSANRSDISVFGGGDLTVVADEDFTGGALFADGGDIHLQAGGGLLPHGDLPTFIVLGDGSAVINTNKDTVVGSVANATVMPRAMRTPSGGAIGGNYSSYFTTYTNHTSAQINSLSGDVVVQPQRTNRLVFLFPDSFGRSAINSEYLSVYAPSFGVTAFNGDIDIAQDITLYPSKTGRLQLIAQNDISSGVLRMSDANPLDQPVPTEPRTVLRESKLSLDRDHNLTPLHLGDHEPAFIVANNGNITGKYILAKQARVIAGNDIRNINFETQNVHEEDYTVMYAGRDIRYGVAENANNKIEVSGPGRLDLFAQRHIDLGGAAGVTTLGNLRNPALDDSGADVTAVAGIGEGVDYRQFMIDYLKVHPRQPAFTQSIRDLSGNQELNDTDALAYFEEQFDAGSGDRVLFLQQLNITERDVEAFHDIVDFDRQAVQLSQSMQLTLSKGALTPLDAYNEYSAMTDDQKRDFEKLVKLDSGEIDRLGASLSYQLDAVTRLNQLANWTGETVVTRGALYQVALLPNGQQRPVIFNSFFNELRESGRDATNSGSKDYSRGFDSIASLFPESGDYQGDITMFASRIYTLDGGDINLLVPGGMVNGGLAVATKEANELGVVAQREGNINAFTDGDYIVNQSRVFTLLGGDITMWSSFGDIDAGRGAKTAVSAPEPNISFDASGNVVIDFSGAINGSGIRAIQTGDVKAGDVGLFAVNGTVNAGDAGIAGGNVTIGAREVLGADNIDIGGISVGVPTGNTSIAASLSGVSDVATSASKSAEETVASTSESAGTDTPVADAALSYLEVFVIGLGDESQTENVGNGNGDLETK